MIGITHTLCLLYKSNETQENIDEIYCLFYIFISEIIKKIYFHLIGMYILLFWITSDFSINLPQCTSELQTPITFLFVNENIKCGYVFPLLDEKFGFAKFFRFSSFAPPSSAQLYCLFT